ncbi:hypothetical protein SBOR_7379 [Sclerotinia borealis F-4128]|uniref:AA1-like domain-containing protein n=1 Tax=Sclerotinia borealis (strain F-4128) TaxID=1432307 RepID=W9C8X0_SCLBF|nr:hypothetical protein SBOR_7379 [Sclerotinia borealis F-4128]
MQFSTLLLSVAALVPSALACLVIDITYTLQTASSSSKLRATIVDNGGLVCYKDEINPSTASKSLFQLDPNVANVHDVNETFQECVAGYHTKFQVDLSDKNDKKGNNVMESYTYLDQFGNNPSYGPFGLGARNKIAATSTMPEQWNWHVEALGC